VSSSKICSGVSCVEEALALACYGLAVNRTAGCWSFAVGFGVANGVRLDGFAFVKEHQSYRVLL
jgi:hypothetical protein